ncbi:MAG: type II toxin-antitoxin system HicB family antitoxin [Chloroflexi bacterium]|nr:type II toxin-antitoxin system HicB family antitoxin [Chloroflexota bacterium]
MNQREYAYAIVLEPDAEEGGYAVKVPAPPGCVTQGDTLDDAIAMAKDAIALYLASLVADGQSTPMERARPQAITVKVAA